ncbi:outer dense fiber protein 2-like isoform X2 [Gouania willdenowi]|uniref:outer dense fiber protein 2-like isoform X2 n=1 Tax=Gouania willdenowi TaxID=441366 RepID=UPI0010568CC6|nr:outer dense fiber protein 2-like isoform X2 [Gouania willdenowi]
MVLPPPVHVHLPEVTELHVHMKKNTSKLSQSQAADGRSKVLKPWIPPGKPTQSCSFNIQKCRSQSHHQSQTEPQEDLSSEPKQLHVLLTQQENIRHSKKWTSECEHREDLLRALVEAEIDGIAIANQLITLNETINSVPKDKCLPASLKRQQELLMEKIAMFDNTNVHLGELLRKRGSLEEDLNTRLANSKVENNRLSVKLSHKEREILQLAQHLDSEKDNRRIKDELLLIMESTRNHVESQLSRAHHEYDHLETQIQEVQQNLRLQQEEFEALQEELEIVKKEKQQQEALSVLTQQALTAQEMLSEAVSTSGDWYHRLSKEQTAKKHLEEQISVLSSEQTKLQSQLQVAEEKSRIEKDQLRNSFQHLSSEKTSITLENQQLQGKLTSCEDQIRELHFEAGQLKSSIKKNENQVEKYKRKVQQVRLEAEENFLKLEETQKEVQEVNVCFQREKEQLMERLREMEVFPDRVKHTEEQLREAQEKTRVHERRSTESCAALTVVRHKVEQQGSELEMFQQKNSELQMENKYLKEKIFNLERTLGGMKVENLSQTVCEKESSVCRLQQQINDRTRECSVLSAQLQQALEDTQRQVDGRIHRVLSKERTSQSKALDLQRQVISAQTELSRLQQSKEEMERHFQMKLRNVKERLDQSDSTNHSLHNYVDFLKTSYGNVFGASMFTR